MPSPAASSSKRQAQAPPAASPHPHKHPRKSDSPSVHTPDGGDGGDGADHYPEDDAEELVGITPDMDDEARAKVARKEARTIRNRESAQRSRNQRKHHLAWLETRVVELEAENRALRGDSAVPTASTAPGTPAPPTASSQAKRGLSAQPHPTTSTPTPAHAHAHREPSPAQSVMSLASDLGLPAELVGAGAGVSLASVAPPPADLALQVDPGVSGRGEEEDVKPILLDGGVAVGFSPQSAVGGVGGGLEAENAVLRERVALLENLVKQVVAVSDLSGLVPPVLSNPSPALAPPPAPLHEAIGDDVHPDWTAFLSLGHAQPHPHAAEQGGLGLESTLSPPLFSAFDLPGAAQAGEEGFGRQPKSSLGAGAETLGVALPSHSLPLFNAQSHTTSQPQTPSQTSTQPQPQPQPQTRTQTQTQSTLTPTTQPSNPVACHSAVVARRGPAAGEGELFDGAVGGQGVGAGAGTGTGEGAGTGEGVLSLGLGLETTEGTAMDLDAELLSWDSAMSRLIEDVEGQAEMAELAAGLGAGVRVKQEREEREWWAGEGVMV
ncbi:hypothetical protein IAT38_006347 [Cryptococcus sp. DSM 104549]